MPKEKRIYLTENGLEKVKKEYTDLKKHKLSQVNKEFFPEDLDFLNVRINELENILRNFKLIKIPSRERQNIINLGARVTVEVDSQVDEFEIVGSLEANPSLGKISNDSPVGRALLGHQIGEDIVISSPIKTIYRIKKIKY